MSSEVSARYDDVDVLIVGGGFAGISALYTFREEGHSVLLVERGTGVGGTWFWNRYPGARVDVESMEYSFGFLDELQQEWHWNEKYSAQPEVLRYLEWVTDRLDLRRDMRFGHTVASLTYSERDAAWVADIETETRARVNVRARYVVLATGFLSTPNLPAIPGLDTFEGVLVHTGAWPDQSPDLTGRRVGVVGTAASGVQVVQAISPIVESLSVFQRSAHWCFPLRNQPMDPAYEAYVKENYAEIRSLEQEHRGPGMVLMGGTVSLPESRKAMDVSPEERVADWETRWRAGGVHIGRSFTDLVINEEANQDLRRFLEAKIREIVRDPQVAEKLIPPHPPLSRRPPGEDGYYESFNRNNVELVDIRSDPIVAIGPRGPQLASGAVYDLDVLVFATGFDAAGGAALRIDIRGRDGQRLADHWAAAVRTHLGVTTSGFPNLFLLNGPQSPAPHFSPPLLAHFQSTAIARLISSMEKEGVVALEPRPEAEEAWLELANSLYQATLIWDTDSWWVGANIPGKPRQAAAYAGGFAAYRSLVEQAFDGLTEYRLQHQNDVQAP